MLWLFALGGLMIVRRFWMAKRKREAERYRLVARVTGRRCHY
jgi:hypothetical protein